MRLYLAGPMRNYAQLNHPAFDHAAILLRAHGHTVFSPAEHDREVGIGPRDAAKAEESIRHLLGADLAWICAMAEGLVMLPGWMQSPGALAEAHTAWALGLPVWPLHEFLAHGRDAAQHRMLRGHGAQN